MKSKNIIHEDQLLVELTIEEYASIEGGSVFNQMGRWVGVALEELANGDLKWFTDHNVGAGVPI